MGADQFMEKSTGKTAKEAFNKVVEEARYEVGHGGYTGTIAEKDSFVEFKVPEGMTVQEFVRACADGEVPEGQEKHADLIKRAYEVSDDKWGPAVCIQIAPEVFVFFGWASS